MRPALAERLPSAEAIIEKLGQAAVERKYDGFRCQVHKAGDDIKIFSRNLEDMTVSFPEIVEGARRQGRQHGNLRGRGARVQPALRRISSVPADRQEETQARR